jgi:hypothetical protein
MSRPVPATSEIAWLRMSLATRSHPPGLLHAAALGTVRDAGVHVMLDGTGRRLVLRQPACFVVGDCLV